MSLASKFEEATATPAGLPCGIKTIIDLMNKEDAKALEEALFEVNKVSGVRLSNTKIHSILVEEGYKVSPSTIAHHRRKQCRCFTGVSK